MLIEAVGRPTSIGWQIVGPACAAMVALSSTSYALTNALDARAYNIKAKPQAGPVETFQPIAALPPIDFRLPFDWGADPFGDKTWRFRLHTLRVVDGALAAGDFDYARSVFLDWQRWHDNCWVRTFVCFEQVADQSWDDMATGIRASRLGFLLRATGWADEQLIELAEQHAERLKEPEFVANNNHALFQLHGLAALCLDRKLRACDGVDAFIERELGAVLRDQFAASGMHRENSPGYHFFITDVLATVAPLLEKFVPDLATVIKRAKTNEPWLVHPDGTTVLLGDSTAQDRRRLILPRGNAGCREARSYEARPDCYLVKHFDDVGYVVIRSDWAIPPEGAAMLFVRGGFFNRTHRDADDFSFEWFEHGRKILSDSGKYAYTKDEWNEYFDSTRAHNTVEVDYEDYPRREDFYGDAVESIERTARSVSVVMSVDRQGRYRQRREIRYVPGEELTVRDMLWSDRPRQYVQWHHFAREFEVTGEAGRFQASDSEMVVDVELTSSCGEDTTYAKVKGQTTPRIQGWASVADRERHSRWALGTVCRAAEGSFTARFKLTAQ